MEAPPEPFDGVEVGAVAGQKPALEVMPAKPRGLVPGSVVEDEDAALAGFGRDGLGEVVQKALEDVGIDPVKDQGKALAGPGARAAARADGRSSSCR